MEIEKEKVLVAYENKIKNLEKIICDNKYIEQVNLIKLMGKIEELDYFESQIELRDEKIKDLKFELEQVQELNLVLNAQLKTTTEEKENQKKHLELDIKLKDEQLHQSNEKIINWKERFFEKSSIIEDIQVFNNNITINCNIIAKYL